MRGFLTAVPDPHDGKGIPVQAVAHDVSVPAVGDEEFPVVPSLQTRSDSGMLQQQGGGFVESRPGGPGRFRVMGLDEVPQPDNVLPGGGQPDQGQFSGSWHGPSLSVPQLSSHALMAS